MQIDFEQFDANQCNYNYASQLEINAQTAVYNYRTVVKKIMCPHGWIFNLYIIPFRHNGCSVEWMDVHLQFRASFVQTLVFFTSLISFILHIERTLKDNSMFFFFFIFQVTEIWIC